MNQERSKPRGLVFYLLLGALVGIWGYVFHLLGQGMAEGKTGVPVRALVRSPEAAAPVQRDRQASFAEHFRDPFAPHPDLFVPVVEEATVEVAKPSPEPPPLVLQGLFERTALLEDTYRTPFIVAAGDSIRDVRVVAVDERGVVLSYADTSFTLRLDP